MPDAQPSELAAKIVAAYLRHHQVGSDQLASLIWTVHQALAGYHPVVGLRTDREESRIFS